MSCEADQNLLTSTFLCILENRSEEELFKIQMPQCLQHVIRLQENVFDLVIPIHDPSCKTQNSNDKYKAIYLNIIELQTVCLLNTSETT